MMHAWLLCLAAQAQPLTLEESVERALAFHVSVQSQHALMDDARSYERQARTWPNPVFSAVAQDVGLSSAGAPPLVLQQTVSFPVLFMYTRMLEQRVAAEGINQARALVDEQRRQISVQVGRAYFDQLLQAELTRIEEEGVALAKQQVLMIRKRVENGDASPLDVERALAEELDAQRALELAQRRREAAALGFSMLAGQPDPVAVVVHEDWNAAERMLRRLPTLDAVVLRKRVLAQRPDVRAARAALLRAQEQQALEARRVIPLADVQLSVAARQSALGTGAVVGITAPIPAFDRNQGPRERARAATNNAHAVVARVERQAVLELETALLLWRRANAALHMWALPAVAAREKTLQGVEAQYAAGTALLVDVIAARRDVLAARRSLAQTRLESAVAGWDLLTTVGIE